MLFTLDQFVELWLLHPMCALVPITMEVSSDVSLPGMAFSEQLWDERRYVCDWMHTTTSVVKLLHGQWFFVYIHIQDATVSTKLYRWDIIVIVMFPVFCFIFFLLCFAFTHWNCIFVIACVGHLWVSVYCHAFRAYIVTSRPHMRWGHVHVWGTDNRRSLLQCLAGYWLVFKPIF